MLNAAPASSNGNQNWTYADYKEWEFKPDERFELINGIAYALAAPNTGHQLILSSLHGEFYHLCKGKKCKAIPAPFAVRLFYAADESDNTVVQPDLVVVCDPEKLGSEGCRGAPDLVVEILSPSTTAIKMHRKLNLYWDAGVGEYWVIDPEEKLIEVYRLTEGRYHAQILRNDDILEPGLFPGLEINLKALFAPV